MTPRLLEFILSLRVASIGKPLADIAHDYQRDWLAAACPSLAALLAGDKPDKRQFWFEATKGAGKDFLLARIIESALAFPSKRPLLIQVGAADRDQAAEVRKSIEADVRANPQLAARLTVGQNTITCEQTGSVCEILAADVFGSHGARPDILILNELSHVSKREFAENLLDNAAKMPSGLVFVATNAGQQGTWQHDWREIARTSPRWSFHQWAAPAPHLDPADVAEAAKRNSPARQRRLFHGEWLAAGSGDAFAADDIAAMFADDLPAMDGSEAGYSFCAGLDLGISKDFSALAIVAKHQSGRYRVAKIHVWQPPAGGKVDLAQVEQTIFAAQRQFNLRATAADPWQAEYIVQRLKQRGVRIEARPQSGAKLVEQCMMLLEQVSSRNIDSYAHAGLMRDLQAARIEERSYGCRLVADRTVSGHADALTALSIALAAAKDIRPAFSQLRLDSVDNLAIIRLGERLNRAWLAGESQAARLYRN